MTLSSDFRLDRRFAVGWLTTRMPAVGEEFTLTGLCLAVECEVSGGMSGGPVFDSMSRPFSTNSVSGQSALGARSRDECDHAAIPNSGSVDTVRRYCDRTELSIAAAFSAIIRVGAQVLPEGDVGITDASIT